MEEAIREGSLQRVQELIRIGADVNAWCKDGSHTMLMLAIILSHEDIALALLAARADVRAKDKLGDTAIHWASVKKSEKVVQTLIDQGSPVDEADRHGFTPLLLVDGNPTISMRLLRAGASCKGLSTYLVDELFRRASSVGDLLAVGALLKNGCSVSALSRGEQEKLLHCACRESDIHVAVTLIKNGCSVGTLSRKEQVNLLCCTCRKGDMLIVEALIAANCYVSCVDSTGDTPLMNAALEGREEVMKKLILADANLAMRDENGDTALHFAARHNHIQCGVLLAEGGASVRTKNKLSQTPLDLAKVDFQEGIKQALSFTIRKTLSIIGNAEGGKSTLITALKAESNWFLGRIYNRFRRVDDRRKRTAGIETVSHSSQKYGEVLFFDFAGQDDYHGPHQMFLESLFSKPGVSMTLLLVIKVTETEESILHQLHRWLTPVALMSITASPPHVIVIGSFLDKVKSKQEATGKLMRCIEETRRDLEALPLMFVGTCFLNCRQPQSEGIDQLCSVLQDVPTPEFRATHTGYSLAWVLFQIRSSIKAQALQLQEFSAWIEDNKDNLPRTMPDPEEVCRDLSAAGHALYLPNSNDRPKSWLMLNLPSILHDVYGTLFSQPKEIVNEFGLLHSQHLAKLFPDLELAMVQQLLISLEFCIPVDPAVLMMDVRKLTESKETSGWLFFPALISAKPPPLTPEVLPGLSVRYLCWQLRTSKKHSISVRILQTILLRLAAHFVVKQRDEEGVQRHCCRIWWNGIAWQSTVGVHVTVHITNNRVIQVSAAGKLADVLCPYLTEVISDILSTVRRLSPNLAAAAYIVHPPKRSSSTEDATAISPKELYPVEGIQHSIREENGFALPLKYSDNLQDTVSITDLFAGFTPTLEYIEKIIWTQTEPNQPPSPAELNQPAEGNGAPADSQVALTGAQALLDISSTPDMRDIDDLVVISVAANWQRLALRLGVEGCVSEIVFKNHPNDYEGACLDVLGRWRSGERHTGEEERTWSTLMTALCRAGFVDLERRLRREHFMKQ